jgi:hypothetical protein
MLKQIYKETSSKKTMKKKKNFENLEIMNSFTEKNLPGLKTTILGALELFIKKGLPTIEMPRFKKPIIMGSGNAEVTARLLFHDTEAIFVNENNFKEVINRDGVDGAIIFSASGEKHATISAKYFTKHNIKTILVTCNPNSTASKIVGKENTIVTVKNREPYTYNTSTYLGWILAKSRENPEKILNFITKKVEPCISKKIGKYNGYLFVTPETFANGNRLFEVKFIELFGRRIARDVRTFEELKHAITVVPYEKELCVQFGNGSVDFDPERILHIPLPKNAGPGTIMAIGYYIIGHIAENKPQWFKENIGKFIAKLNKTKFGKNLRVIVE